MVSSFLVDYPFTNRLYPGSRDAIEHLRKWGVTIVLSDGDVVFVPVRFRVPDCGMPSRGEC
jgi:hypothetical protein